MTKFESGMGLLPLPSQMPLEASMGASSTFYKLIIIFSPGNVTYSMSSPHCGMVSLRDRPGYPISQFTEQQLRDGDVVFTHSGKVKQIRIMY